MRKYNCIDKLLSFTTGYLHNEDSNTAYPASEIAGPEPDHEQKKQSAQLMRINHAGEVSAQGLYHGHAAIARNPEIKALFLKSADEELNHLLWCEKRLIELNDTKSVFTPLWYGCSFMLGYIAGLAGDEYSLGFIAATESLVEEHLQGHLDQLATKDPRSSAILKQMQDEEVQHQESAQNAGAVTFHPAALIAMRMTSQVMIQVSKRL